MQVYYFCLLLSNPTTQYRLQISHANALLKLPLGFVHHKTKKGSMWIFENVGSDFSILAHLFATFLCKGL